MREYRLLVTGLGLLTLPARAGLAQSIPLSQHATVSQRVGHTDIDISYNRPVARGRKLFGDLAKWRRVWAPGGDTAPSIPFRRRGLIEGKTLRAGQDTIWALPETAPRAMI